MPSERGVIFAVAVALFAGFCIVPPVFLLVSPALTNGWKAYGNASLDARQLGLLFNSMRIAGGAAALATLIGAPPGFLLARAPIRFKNAVRLGLVIPVLLPTYTLGLSWIYFGGSCGIAARLLGVDLLSGTTYSAMGAVVVLGWRCTRFRCSRRKRRPVASNRAWRKPACLLRRQRGCSRGSPSRLSGRVSRAGRCSRSSSRCPITRCQTCFASASSPPKRSRPFAALYDVSRATSLALPLIGVALLIGYAVTWGSRGLLTTARDSSGVGIGLRRLGPIPTLGIACVFGGAVLLPLGVLAAETGRLSVMRQALSRSGMAVAETVVLSSIAATVIAGVSLMLGHRRARSDHRFARWFDVALVALFAVPGTIVGVAPIALWNRAGSSGAVYGSPAIVLIAYLGRFMPVGILIVGAAARHVSRSGEDAAAVSGAGWVRTMRHIVVPQLETGLALAWVLVFVLAFGEVGASVLVAPPGHAPYPVHVFTLIANAPADQVAALGLVQAAIVVCPFVLGIVMALRPRPREREQ